MKVITLLGTRPEIIRLSRVIPLFDESCDHLLVHTGQNFEDRLSGLFSVSYTHLTLPTKRIV